VDSIEVLEPAPDSGVETPPPKKRVRFLTKETKAKLAMQARKRRDKLRKRKERRAIRLSKEEVKLAVDKLSTKRVKKQWEESHKQFELFMTDALIPRANKEWTSGTAIYKAYEKYCRAINQTVDTKLYRFYDFLRDHYMNKQMAAGQFFGCILRPNLFVEE
jgi:hypothetical protein